MKDLIKEVAPLIASEIDGNSDDLTAVVEHILTRGLAELSKRAESVAWVEVIDRHEGPYNFNGKELLDSGKHLLFTFPPIHDIEAIENRVAEAICKQLSEWSMYETAECIQLGEWRKYK